MSRDVIYPPVGEGGVGFRIQHLWAYLAIHGDGDEGVMGLSAGGLMLPMIAADQTRLRQLEPEAKRLVALGGIPAVLAQFGSRTDLERIDPP